MDKAYYSFKRPELLQLIPRSAKSIIDLGCGTGELGKSLKARQPCHVTGIELNKTAALAAKENLDVCYCDNLNRYNPVTNNRAFDCMIFGDIREHIIYPWQVLQKFTKVLSAGGTVIASIPNIAHPSIISRLEQGLFRYTSAGILDITHLRFFTKATISQLFYRAGLKITNLIPFPSEKNPIQWLISATKPPPQQLAPIVTILILTYNTAPMTLQCIQAVKALTKIPFKILVIDNGSTDDTVRFLRAQHDIFHIEADNNLGFATGFNLGIELIDTPYFIILNSDVIITTNWIKRMIEHLEDAPKVMAIGPRTNYVSGPQRVKYVPYKSIKELGAFAEAFNGSSINQITYLKRLVFFCTLFKKEVVESIGFLDEQFGKGNFEDDDYCFRIHKSGHLCAMDNTVFVHHYGSQTFKQAKIDFEKSMQVNGLRFMKKWGIESMEDYYRYLNS